MSVAPKLFRSADTGAATLTGEVGKLTTIMDECLVCKRQFTAVSGASFVDNSVVARLEAGATFALFQGPTANNDEAYFGLQQPFEQVVFKFGTLGAGGTLVWEYWNGAAWTSFVPTDGTSGFTQDGRVSWSIAALTSWATTAVNSITVYWIRVRFTGTFSVNPLVNSLTITGWAVAFSGTNKRIYRMGAGSAGLMIRVQDDGNNFLTAVASGAGAKEAQFAGCETATAIDTVTNEFPTNAQLATRLAFRKSTSADSVVRDWTLLSDDRTFYFIPGTAPGTGTVVSGLVYATMHFGEFYSFQPGDPWKVVCSGRAINNNLGSAEVWNASGLVTVLVTGLYMARNYTAIVGGQQIGQHGDFYKGSQGSMQIGGLPFPNSPDGGVWLAEIVLSETTGGTGHVRGKLRGLWAFLNSSTVGLTDQSVVQGAGALAGKTFRFYVSSSIHVATVETSDTWPTST